MEIREAKFKEIPKLVELLLKANEEFGHASVPVCKDTIRNTLQRVINQPHHAAFVLIDDDGVFRGIMVGLVNQLWYSRKRQVTDLIFYVDKNTRGHGAKLLSAYMAWARTVSNVKEIMVGITSGTDEMDRVDGLLRVTGMNKVGGTYALYPDEEKTQEDVA